MLINPSPLVEKVIGCAIDVHKALGPGLTESPYEHCLSYEFTLRGIPFARQVTVPIRYKEVVLDCAYRADLIVEGELLVELKSVERLLPIHTAQVITYLRLLNLKQGLLMNFNSCRLVDGLKNVLVEFPK